MNKTYFVTAILFTLSLFLQGCATQSQSSNIVTSGSIQSYRSEEKTNTNKSEDSSSLPKLDEKSSLSDYLSYAALNNPGLEAAFNHWKAALEQVPQVKQLPDPRFNYRYYIQQVETRVGAQRQAFGISQMFPWFGKLDLRADAATEAAQAAGRRYEAAKLKLFYQVKDAYYEYYYLWRAISIVRENIQLLENFESVVRTRYQVTAAQHPDLIRVQVELGKLEDRLKTLEDLQGPIVARLNAALNRPAEAAIPWPQLIKEENISLTDKQILDWMADSNPELAAIESEVAKNKVGIDLAKKDYYPDITLGVDYIDTADSISPNPPKDSGQDAVIAMLSLNIPMWKDRLDAAVRQAKYQYYAAMQSKTEKLNTLSSQLKLALYQFRDGERKIGLYHDTLLPKAVESVKASETAFQAGSNTFLDLIDAQRVLLEFELSYERALANKAQRLAEIEMLVGREIPRAGN
jgi:cobalt-zinc-cadmium efflux system outer membrane protein